MSEVWQARLERERRARKEAERLLEEKSRALYAKNQELAALTRGLEREVAARTQELAVALAAEREMNHKQRSFVTVVSHEFRTPLAVIDGAAQRLARNADAHDPADVRERARRVRLAVGQMTALIERILSSDGFNEGRIEIDRRPTAMLPLVEAACARQRGLSPDFEIDVALCGAPDTLDVDARLIDQVLSNLLSNAVKYSGDSRRVEVTGGVDGRWFQLTVRDHGVGIPPDEVGKLFARFFRASTAKGIPGTGIGLNLVKQIVELHGGAIRVQPCAPRGTAFIVRLPLPAPAEQAA